MTDMDPETEWAALRTAAREAALKHLGHNRLRRKDWLTGPTLMLANQASHRASQRPPTIVKFVG